MTPRNVVQISVYLGLTSVLLYSGCSKAGSPSPKTGITQALGVSQGSATTTDSAKNVYIAGYTGTGLNGNTLTGTNDFFVGKYDSSGNLTWLKQLGVSSQTSQAYGIAVDSSQNVYVTGYTTGGLNGNTQTGGSDYFVAKYSSNGTLTWLNQLGVKTSTTKAFGVAVDPAQNVYVTGFTTAGLNGNTQSGTQDYFIAKYASNGTLTWLKQQGAGALQTSEANGISVDSAQNVYVVGDTTAGLGGNSQEGVIDYFVAKYDINGNLTWLKQLGANLAVSQASAVTLDASANIYVAGYTGLTTTGIGLNGVAQTGLYDYFIAQYDSNGDLTWLKQVGVADYTTKAYGVSVDSSQNSYVVGYTNGGLNGNSLTGTMDVFAAKYSPTGALTWVKQLGVAGFVTEANGVSVDSSQNIYVVGDTFGPLNGITQQTTFGFPQPVEYFIAKYSASGSLE